jgi:hypothetical protein
MKATVNALKRAAAAGTAAMACAWLGGCFDEHHYVHRDLVSEVAGDANAVNSATQTINPWPKEAQNSKIDVDGKRLGIAVQRYQTNTSIPPESLNTSKVSQGTHQPAPQPPAQDSASIQK